MKIFLTGRSGSGKSTVLMKVIKQLEANGLKIGGITTPEVRANSRRVAFRVVDLSSGETGVLASINQPTGPMVGKYRVNLPDFERVALPALDFALRECDVVCVDELGKMEFFSAKFKQKINEILRSGKPVIAVVHRDYAENYGKIGTLLHVTQENREEIVDTIMTLLKL